jgi:hypothetical protein
VGAEFTSVLSSITKDLGDLQVSCVLQSPAGEMRDSYAMSKAK